ncbi:IS66 family insertion sequence element accessory protein TnpB [Allopusillimonas ginsengisoli]|uniref:IS66 family insertion sequence element accessory protein TnpB n=1 Tax=Allopusillimonas ginsengisoli TaxID=453575 RepID=UPI0039C0622F
MCLLAKRLEHGHFVWPGAESGAVHLTPAQLSMLLKVSIGAARRALTSRPGFRSQICAERRMLIRFSVITYGENRVRSVK